MDHSNGGGGFMGFGDAGGSGLSPLMMMPPTHHHPSSSSDHHHHHNQHQQSNGNIFFLSNLNSTNPCSSNNSGGGGSSINNNANLLLPFAEGDNIKSKIMSHPHYPRLLSAYVNCHKIGAPPEVVAKLEQACNIGGRSGGGGGTNLGEDPALDQFMEAYCEMLTKYEEEISKPFKEAMLFFSRVESQFKSLSLAAIAASPSSPSPVPIIQQGGSGGGGNLEKYGSSDEDGIDMDDENYIDPQAEDRELKGQLLRRYSGYLGSLKKEFLKKRKKGKLPKEARQQLLDWWNRHLKWPYPSESQKLALAESTGLDPKQINNWFINQRKRHWKPTEEMQFVVMDAAHPSHYYFENGYSSANPFSVDCGGTSLF